MEKLIYAVWKPDTQDQAAFNAALTGTLRPRLVEAGAHRLQINIPDQSVATGEALKIVAMTPQPSALVSFWVNTAHVRPPLETAVKEFGSRIAGYSVLESTVLTNLVPTADGERVRGFSQIALIGRPPRLTWEAWFDLWQRTQTKVACDTQSTFYYCQNIIVRKLTYGAPDWSAIVEECFPIEALTDQTAFYGAPGDTAKYEENLQIMMRNCSGFIDFDRIDVLVTSAYRYGGWCDLNGQPDWRVLSKG